MSHLDDMVFILSVHVCQIQTRYLEITSPLVPFFDSDEVGVDYKPSLDYGRFQQLLAQAEDEMEREKEAGRDGRRGQHMTDKLLEELAAKLVDSRVQGEIISFI